MKPVIFIAAIVFAMLFNSIISILGLNYLGAEESTLYSGASIILNIIVMFFFFKDLHTRKIYVTKKLLFIILGQILLLILYVLESPTNQHAQKLPLLMFSLAMPLCYVGYDVAATNSWSKMTRWLDILALLITIGVAINMPKIITSRGYVQMSNVQDIVNVNYQAAAYFAAFAYSINLVLMTFGDLVENRFRIFKAKSYSVISVFILVLQIALCLMSGGRGGAVLLIVATFVIFFISDRRKLGRIFFSIFIAGIIGFIIAIFVFPSVVDSIFDVIAKSTQRTFEYISSEGIDMKATSRRDLEYGAALSCIADSPIIGHGIYRYIQIKNYSIYPHNFFLEILLQGGIVLLMIVMAFLISLYKKYKKMIKYDKVNILLLPFILYPAVLLLFSGTYMVTSYFWFVLTYLYVYKFRYSKDI